MIRYFNKMLTIIKNSKPRVLFVWFLFKKLSSSIYEIKNKTHDDEFLN